jgi:hypothetical protein
MNIAWMSSTGMTASLTVVIPLRRRVGLPVAADGLHVVGGRHRPEARLVGVLGDPAAPVHRALRAQLLEQGVRRAVDPVLGIDEP